MENQRLKLNFDGKKTAGPCRGVVWDRAMVLTLSLGRFTYKVV